MSVKIEIGANTGSHTVKLAADGSLVYSFEPSTILYKELVEKFVEHQNILVLPIAIDIENSVKFFNISTQGDRGFGSLYDFSDNLQETELSRYNEFKIPFLRKDKVLTMRLDTFMNTYGIDSLDYLHIDAQGNDFNCIKSLGDRIKDVKEGQCECTWEIKLYDGPDNYYENVQKYLEEVGGFKVEILYKHQHKSEIDLKFYR